MSTHSTSPFALLAGADQKYRNLTASALHESPSGQEWTGVLFRVGKDNLLAPMVSILEIVPLGEITPIPGVRPWVRGLANLHGNLVTVIDLEGFLYGRNQDSMVTNLRLLVVSNSQFQVGLVVREVFGMKHFWASDVSAETVSVDPRLTAFLGQSFNRHGEHYGVFELEKLLADRDFQSLSID